jgi:hypothetical protein
MTKNEALTLLENAIRNDTPSKINPAFTRRQAVEIVERGVRACPDGDKPLDALTEKRVWQVCDNVKRPRGR